MAIFGFMVMVLDWKTNLATSNERLFSLRGIFLQPGIAKEFCRPASCHEDAIISAYGLSI
ncbi:hypothetical protein [Sphingobium scionense]|uniref:Uncharacterized protein n=1 Tax=Sphingobium scionense TaxID=1404341 RepID=A0A7W6LTE4_9SPHN|nr:hypothetical protein [Sphingobium scionense]MBB4150129.1 hypothetical protein [Sphingobium scionense]